MTSSVDEHWPDEIPLPSIDFQGATRYATLISPRENPTISRRSRQYRSYGTISVTWNIGTIDYDAFQLFFSSNLENGSAAFAMELRHPKKTELAEWIVRFIGGYKVTCLEGVWKIEATLDLINPTLLEAEAEVIG